VIDADGYRLNVGIILANGKGKVLWARRVGEGAWQFPQGGIKRHESPEQALYRELGEELGLGAEHVVILGCTRDWLRYRLPKRYVRRHCKPVCIGQKQLWYLLSLSVGCESAVRLDACRKPEFDFWKWVDYWHAPREVIAFKRGVYKRALRELAPLFYAQVDRSQAEGADPGADEARRPSFRGARSGDGRGAQRLSSPSGSFA